VTVAVSTEEAATAATAIAAKPTDTHLAEDANDRQAAEGKLPVYSTTPRSAQPVDTAPSPGSDDPRVTICAQPTITDEA